jgi:hypothetical protein
VATFSPATAAELEVAFRDAVDGDTIELAATTFSGFTQNLSSSKSITVGLASGTASTTLTMGSYRFVLDGQAGGTVQTWVGPILPSTDTNQSLFDVDSSLGSMAITMSDITVTGPGGADSGSNGFLFDASASFATTATLTGCAGNDNGNDGFGSYCAGEGSGGTCKVTLTSCSATGNGDEGASPHNSSEMTITGGTWAGNAQNQIATGGITDTNPPRLTLNSATITQGGASSGNAISAGQEAVVIIDGCTVTVADGGGGACLSYGTDSVVTIRNGSTLTSAGTNASEDTIGDSGTGGTLLIDSSTVTHTGSQNTINLTSGGTVYATGATITHSGSGHNIRTVTSASNTVVISGESTVDNTGTGRAISHATGDIAMTGGSITADAQHAILGSGSSGSITLTDVDLIHAAASKDLFSGGGKFTLVCTDCTITNTGRRIYDGGGTLPSTFNNCTITHSVAAQYAFLLDTAATVEFWDCNISVGVAMTEYICRQQTNAAVTRFYRCAIDCSSWTGGASATRDFFYAAIGTVHFEGCTYVSMDNAGTQYMCNLNNAAVVASFIHNTLYRTGSTGTNRGIQVNAVSAPPTMRGNVFKDFQRAMVYADAATYYAGTYNMTHGCTNSIYDGVGAGEYGSPHATDDFGTDPQFTNAPTDLSLKSGSAGQFLDPTSAYQQDTFALTLRAIGGGTVTQAPTNDRTSNSKEPKPAAETGIDLGAMNNIASPVTLTATADGGWVFSRWSDDGTTLSTANPYLATMDQARKISGVFINKGGREDVRASRRIGREKP